MADAPKKLAAGGKPYKSKPLSNSKKGPKSVVPKLDEKLSLKISKIAKRKKKNKTGVTALSYTVIPKGKRLAGKVVEKLERDQYHFVLARALEAARKLNKNQTEKVEEAEDDEDEETDEEEEDKFKVASKNAPEYTKWKQNKIRRIAKREKKRRKRRESKIKEELRRKQHRIHPGDLYHMYLEGYERKRHRITKKRFMRCVDINLLQAVMEKNQELMNSPLWDDDLDIHNLSYVRARILKDHLQQFEVLEEALKQGIFNIHGCDELPILNIRRRRRPKRSTKIIADSKMTAESEAKRKLKSDDKKKTVSQPSKRRLTYPPFKEWKDDDDKRRANGGWLSKVTSWIATKSIADGESKAQRSTVPQPDAENTEEHLLEEKDMVENEMDALLREEIQDAETKGKDKKCISNLDVTETGKNKSIVEVSVEIEPETKLERETSLKPKDKPFSDFLTIKVPLRLGEKKKFIYNLVKRRIKDPNNLKNPEWLKNMKEKKPAQISRFDKKYDPMDRLHEDEKQSDIWTISTTTTTDGYASWRRQPALNKSVDETEDWSETDKTFLWRIVLFIIVIWELICFVDKRLDDVYYNALTYHLYRENIWPVRPNLFPTVDTYPSIVVQEWLHFIISLISLPIIHKENECLSLLFAFSLLLDGFTKVASTSHDALFLPHEASWQTVVLYSIHLLWKATIICLFVAYHYQSVDYIRKEREFKHRKVRLHNHEIMAKGTKGLQKRKVAWDWMIRHARNTNVKALKKKYPDVKDGNFPEENLEKDIKFDEAKELRIYAQEHNLNIGYPYNKLRDMKRYVFGELESSNYSSSEVDDKIRSVQKANKRQGRQSVNALTAERFEQFKNETVARKNAEKLKKAAENKVVSNILSTPKLAAKRPTKLRAGNLVVGQDYNAEIGRKASSIAVSDKTK